MTKKEEIDREACRLSGSIIALFDPCSKDDGGKVNSYKYFLDISKRIKKNKTKKKVWDQISKHFTEWWFNTLPVCGDDQTNPLPKKGKNNANRMCRL